MEQLIFQAGYKGVWRYKVIPGNFSGALGVLIKLQGRLREILGHSRGLKRFQGCSRGFQRISGVFQRI